MHGIVRRHCERDFRVMANPRDNGPLSLRARAPLVPRHCERERSEREAIQNWAGQYSTPPALDSRAGPPGLLRRLRRLAMTGTGRCHRRPHRIRGTSTPPSLRARAKRARSNPDAARPQCTRPDPHVLHRPPGLLRPLRGLAMTVATAVPRPAAHDSRHRRPTVIASASESEREAIQKRRGNTVRLPHGIRGAAAPPSLRARAERGRSNPEAARPQCTRPDPHVLHRPPGLLRPLRGLAMTGMDAPPRHDGSRHDGGRAVPSPSGRDHGAGQCETPGGGPPGVREVETVRRPACRVRPSPHARKGRKRAGQG